MLFSLVTNIFAGESTCLPFLQREWMFILAPTGEKPLRIGIFDAVQLLSFRYIILACPPYAPITVNFKLRNRIAFLYQIFYVCYIHS